MNVLDLIEAKKRGHTVAPVDLVRLVDGFTRDEVPRYQMAAFLMAVWFQGMELEETVALTAAMLDSGETLDTRGLGGPTADKHSTGGVGDKVSLLLAPLAAACGLRVPMLSGRGLGHTGGTLDKLEAVPGYRIHLDNATFLRTVADVGCAIVGQSAGIAPADGKIYALRDVTGTVDCVPLITASILSKKLAAGPESIVIDLKTGSGAFMSDRDRAEELARTLVAVGERWGRRIAVLFTDMSQPLGNTVGHASEVQEAFAALRPEGRGGAAGNLVAVTEALTAAMVCTAGLEGDRQAALKRVRAAWDGGAAWERLRAWVEAQGGVVDWAAEDFGLEVLPPSADVTASRGGWLRVDDCRQIGYALADIGGGRRRVEDPVDSAASLTWCRRHGERVERGDVLVRIHARQRDRAETARRRLEGVLQLDEQPWSPPPVVLGRLE